MVVRTTRFERPTLARFGSLLLAFVFLQGLGCGVTQSGLYRSDLGRAPSRQVLANVVVTEFANYGFRIENRSLRNMRSGWRRQTPTELSLAGVTKIRDRVKISIQERGRKYYVASMTIRHEAQVGGAWKPTEPSEAMVKQYNEIRKNIREELRQYMTQKR